MWICRNQKRTRSRRKLHLSQRARRGLHPFSVQWSHKSRQRVAASLAFSHNFLRKESSIVKRSFRARRFFAPILLARVRSVAGAIFAIGADCVAGQVSHDRCQAPEYRQFDFWLGDWEVRDGAGVLEGTNLVTLDQNRCVITEHWASPGQTGISLNVYDLRLKMW